MNLVCNDKMTPAVSDEIIWNWYFLTKYRSVFKYEIMKVKFHRTVQNTTYYTYRKLNTSRDTLSSRDLCWRQRLKWQRNRGEEIDFSAYENSFHFKVMTHFNLGHGDIRILRNKLLLYWDTVSSIQHIYQRLVTF